MAYLIEAKGDLTIKNGTITAPERGIHTTGGTLNLENVVMNCVERCIGAYNDAVVNIDKDCVLTTFDETCQSEDDPDITIMVYSENGKTTAHTVVNIAGQVINNNLYQGGWAISGNGNKDHGDNEINIASTGYVKALSESAIYHPQGGTITVDGTVEGPDGIYMKSGNLVVNEGAVIKGNGSADTVYVYSGDGTKTPLGHGIVLEFTNYPSGIANVTINGGTITSEAKDPIGFYVSPKCAEQDLETLKAAHFTDNR